MAEQGRETSEGKKINENRKKEEKGKSNQAIEVPEGKRVRIHRKGRWISQTEDLRRDLITHLI